MVQLNLDAAAERRTSEPEPVAPKDEKPLSYSNLLPSNWRNYEDILLDSFWVLGRRDSGSVHSAEYWGNFVPQIPHQMMRRFTKKGEVVVDLFAGLGTTLIEGRALGRHVIGVELQERVANKAKELVAKASNPSRVETVVLGGMDSRERTTEEKVRAELKRMGADSASLVMLHPPYFNIIQFSEDPRDLSNALSVDGFLTAFRAVVDNAVRLLASGRFLCLVIGDAYSNKEWVPLGFRCMEECQKAGLRLKAINVKDIQGNERGKGVKMNLWKYRALKGGFYIFKHEYVMVFQKPNGD